MRVFEEEGIDVVLAVREYWYSLLHGTFGGEPTRELMSAFDDGASCGLFDLLANDACEEVETLRECVRSTNRGEGEISRLADEYTRLFVGPGHLDAPPWESPYVGKEGLLFQESTLAVRYAYANFGYLPKEYPKVADDHLALMMDFMAHMAKRSFKAFSESDFEELKTLVEGQIDFLDNHILNWVPEYSKRLGEADGGRFYSAAARCAAVFFVWDRKSLGDVASKLSYDSVA